MGKKYILAGHDEMVANWVASRIPDFEFGRSPYTAIGLVNEAGGMIAGVLFENFVHHDIDMHVASIGGHWLNRTFLGEGFRYPFEQLGCRRVTGFVPASNVKAATFDQHLGFVLEGRLRQKCRNGDDILVFGMLKSECRWLKVGMHRGYEHTTAEFRAA